MAITEPGGAWFNYVPGTMYGVAGGNYSGEQLLNNPSLNTSPSGNPYVANFQNLQMPSPGATPQSAFSGANIQPLGGNFQSMPGGPGGSNVMMGPNPGPLPGMGGGGFGTGWTDTINYNQGGPGGLGGAPLNLGAAGGGGATPWGTAGGLLPGNLSAYPQGGGAGGNGMSSNMMTVRMSPEEWAGMNPGQPYPTDQQWNAQRAVSLNPNAPYGSGYTGPPNPSMPGFSGGWSPIGNGGNFQPLNFGAGSVSSIGAAMNPQGAVSAMGGPNIIPGPRSAPNPTLNPPSATPPGPGDRLASIVGGQGNPINQLPAWQSMVAAQQRNIQENAANLGEQFNLSGNRFGSAFGTAMTDYYNQANLQQNALLGQMTAQAGESAQNRLLNASGQLSSQDFQSMMQQYGLSSQMAQQLFGAQNQAAQGMFGAQNSALAPFLNYNLGQSGIYSNLASQYGNLYQGNLGLGSQLGGQQYGLGQSAINNQYQNWLYQQPQNNPFMQYLQELMTYYPSMVQPGYQPGFLGQALGALGAGAGAYAGAVCWIAEAIYGTNDLRTHLIRRWLNGPFKRTKFGKAIVNLYRKFGKQTANQIYKHPVLKPVFKPLFDIALRKARKYHGNATWTSVLWPADGRTTAWRISAE